ncbi:5-methyltetrahydropteroyltriglutamate--homocysteine S-methyltransferase [Nonomuraea sp. NPDC050404]|uniref:5-methyltetrahydropteroyltriglutamate-- homocysteine S-methyltransferase n=1 Tax=Nonomuraea sp. NPDC050404 TaxID=3155783 RepID=UPI0033F75A65
MLGYPRIGPRCELRSATEEYWAGRLDAEGLLEVGARLRGSVWTDLRAAGLDQIPSNTFSLYDHLLDAAVLVDAVPERFRHLDGLDAYFAMARGADGIPGLATDEWFGTGYQHLVPEIGPGTRFRLAAAGRAKPLAEYLEARALGVETRPVLVGPLTFLLLAASPAGFRPLDLLDDLIEVYAELLERLSGAGATWVQFDEPALACDRNSRELAALGHAYRRLAALPSRPRLLVSTGFGEIGDALPVLAATQVEAIGLDFVAGPGNLEALASIGGLPLRTLVAGVVDGRNVWRTDPRQALATCASLLGLAGEVTVSTSCSLRHVPLDLDAEPDLDPGLRARLSFARQKVDEVVALGRALRQERPATPSHATAPNPPVSDATGHRPTAARPHAPDHDTVARLYAPDHRVRARLDALGKGRPRAEWAVRSAAQRRAFGLPDLATTTIGSFPPSERVLRARADLRDGLIDEAGYERAVRDEIDRVIAFQERLGLDVLVHGEPEREDMVRYFAERLRGFALTRHGWVQASGTHYVRPPILYGDVSRPAPMTVRWATYAQSRTDRPVKGVLTGPVTLLARSYARTDLPRADIARQLSLALRDEIHDLQAAGIGIIQIDEPALRELLPLRQAQRAFYLSWATGVFRLATSGIADTTQIHTHICQSWSEDVLAAIGALDADVTSVESARPRMGPLSGPRAALFRGGVGPGVYDSRSHRVPGVEEMADALRHLLRSVGPDRLWVNPDCGLRTREPAEIESALRNMVAAAARVRAALPAALDQPSGGR